MQQPLYQPSQNNNNNINFTQQQGAKPEKKYLTKYSAYDIALVVSVLSVAGIVLPYVSGIHFKQIEPFPALSLTQSVLHYPGFALFRMGLIPATCLTALLGFMVIWWLQSKAQEVGIELKNLKSLRSSLLLQILFTYIALASIDVSQMNYNIYAYAVAFAYGFGGYTIVLITKNVVDIRNKDVSAIGDKSYYLKLSVVLFLLIFTFEAFISGYVWDLFEQKDGKGLNAFSYYYTLTFYVYIISFLFDWKDYYLEFELDNLPGISMVQVMNQ